MTLSPPRPAPAGTGRANPRAAFLVLVGWYVAVVVAFGLFLGTLSGSVPADCGEGCDSERSRTLIFGLYVAAPAMFLALLVSLAMLAVLVSRTRIRSSVLVGTLSAVLPLAACGVLTTSL
ncbi:hypothetical protein ACWD6L_06370 [Micromonospora profundi]|uniref:Uncharacterized protein n=1 Tax=Micromonospora profundi TaxID=1420889 RepID=A0AAJ6HW41_9ACTN|nr:hypothetical protein [Micromonospora profundi]NJC16094.1 uncharacterized membrane protein YhaH (DUF805 family) [Micromonospora profundi]WLS47512.1 hypothetical protein Q3V37_09920 [Micromonospora profundi]